MNGSNLPGARPMLDCLFALDGSSDVIVPFVIDEALQSIALRKSFDDAFAMFMCAP
jgi:hypothetical protein